MSQNVNFPRGFWLFGRQTNVLLGLITSFFIIAASSVAGEISGTYSDKGVVVHQTATAQPAEVVSFHGLLGQQFNPQLAALDFDQTERFTLNDNGEVLATEMFNADNKRLLRFVWGAHRGFSHEQGKAVIRMQMGDQKDERCVLVLEPAHDESSLLVNVYRVSPSTFGPQSEPIGTYLFVRTG